MLCVGPNVVPKPQTHGPGLILCGTVGRAVAFDLGSNPAISNFDKENV